MNIKTWPQFARRVRPGNTQLLRELPSYPDSILISGCQRSGGTMLAAAFAEHPQITDFSWSKDSELDAAQILSGVRTPDEPLPAGQRYCFQTTYLNERYTEYQQHQDSFKLIWLIRNPHSVVYSMLYNWRRFALNEVFRACGEKFAQTDPVIAKRLNRFGNFGVKPIYRACYAYLGKLEQCDELRAQLPADAMTVIEYDQLVSDKARQTERLFNFAGLETNTPAGGDINQRSLTKANKFSDRERQIVDKLCVQAYEEVRARHTSE